MSTPHHCSQQFLPLVYHEVSICTRIRIVGIKNIPFPPFLIHLPIRTPAQQQKGNDDDQPTHDSGGRQRLPREQPIRHSHDEDGQQGRDRGQDRRGEGNEDEEGAGEGGVGEDGNEHHPRRFTARPLKRLDARVVQNRQGDPEHEEREAADQTPECIRKQHAPHGARPLWRTGQLLIQHLVESVQDTADTNNDVA